MDTLIVLRKPLRKQTTPLEEPKFIIPKKIRKAEAKVFPIPLDPKNSNEAPISFVQLYKDLCVENSRYAPVYVNLSSLTSVRRVLPARTLEPARAPTKLHEGPSYTDYRHVNSAASVTPSDTSLVTQYHGRFGIDHRVFVETPPSNSTRAELILELDYDACSKDSEFCYHYSSQTTDTRRGPGVPIRRCSVPL